MKGNCLICALFYKIKNPSTKIYKVIPKVNEGMSHIIWETDKEFFHFTFINKQKMKKWWQFIWFNGKIDYFPVRFLKEVKLKRIL